MTEDSAQVTQLLRNWLDGDQHARDQLVPVIYDTLHRLASHYLRQERGERTLQPTALVHEAYLRLVDQARPAWESRRHFFGVAARVMRQVLVDEARRRRSQKRGGEAVRVDLTDLTGLAAVQNPDVIALSDALDGLAGFDDRKSRIIELRYFAGFTEDETGRMLGLSAATIRKETRLAEAWLAARMAPIA